MVSTSKAMYNPSRATSVRAASSASALESAVVVCFLLKLLREQFFHVMTPPLTEFKLQLASVKQDTEVGSTSSSKISLLLGKTWTLCGKPLTQRRTSLIQVSAASSGAAWWRPRNPQTNCRSGRESAAQANRPRVLRYLSCAAGLINSVCPFFSNSA